MAAERKNYDVVVVGGEVGLDDDPKIQRDKEIISLLRDVSRRLWVANIHLAKISGLHGINGTEPD